MGQQDLNRRSEIDAFKELNLSVIASSFGYEVVRNKSTRHSVLMQSSNDKIIISRIKHHYVFCSVYDTESNGTAIDFVQRVVDPGCSLGRVRQHLRPFLDGAYFSTVQRSNEGRFAKTIRPSSSDFLAVAARFSAFESLVNHHEYLCGERGIPIELLRSERLRGRVKLCNKSDTIIFPHWGSPDENAANHERALTGYEIKGKGVTMFSKAGRKGLWSSAGFEHDRVLVFTESALDALSYLSLHPSGDIRIASLAGQINSHQPELIRSAIGKMGEGIQVVAAFDNDKGGDTLTEMLAELFHDSEFESIGFEVKRPTVRGMDWNAVLNMNRHECKPNI